MENEMIHGIKSCIRVKAMTEHYSNPMIEYNEYYNGNFMNSITACHSRMRNAVTPPNMQGIYAGIH